MELRKTGETGPMELRKRDETGRVKMEEVFAKQQPTETGFRK